MKGDRLVSLLLMLQSAHRRTAGELAEALEVSTRTIYRDVDALSAAGVPIYTERGSDGGIALSKGYRQALLHLGEEEVRALFITGSAILADLGLGGNLDRALDKLRGGFSDTQRRVAEKSRSRIVIDQRRWNQDDPPVATLAALRRAVWDDRCVELEYEDRSGVLSRRRCEPYGLVSKAGVWYLIANTSDGFRSFRADRIRSASELPQRFERPEDFDLESHWSRTSRALFERRSDECRAVVRVAPEVREVVGAFWGARKVNEDDESLLELTFPSESIAARQLLSWGPSVELIDPASLAAAVVAHAQEAIARYRSIP